MASRKILERKKKARRSIDNNYKNDITKAMIMIIIMIIIKSQ